MKKILSALLASTGLFCSAGTARIDLISGNAGLRVVSTAAGVSGKNMNWLPPEKAKRMLYFQQRNSCDEWSTMKFSFAADRDTTVRITLRGPYLVTPQKKRLPAAVFYDELRIDGKPAPNGGFEPGENAGRRWNHLISDRGLAASGNGVLRVTHDDPESFSLRVKAGKPVQIEVLHRDAGLLEPGPDVTPLPLARWANRAFADQTAGDGKGGWTDQGEQSLRGIVPQRSYGGMEFDIPASGNAVVTMDSPHDRTGVKTFTLTPGSEKKYAFLYLLHAAAWVASSGEKLGSATVQYTDGSESRFSVENGRNICDWWLMTALPNARSVYLQNREEGRGGFLMTRFPLDAKPVKQVRFDTLGKGIWVIVGASLSSRDVSVQTKQRECRFTAPRWKRADMQQLDLVEGSALDLSGRKRFSPEKDGAMQIDRNGAITFRTQEGKPVRLIGFNAFPSLYRMKGASREEIHRTIDRCLEQAKRMGYDYFRTNFLLDRDPFQGAAADFEFNPEYLDRLDYLVAACRRYGLYIYGTTASYQLGRKEWNKPFQQRAALKNETLFGVPARREEWKKLIVKLLTHVNPYTGIAYKDDPAFLCFEFYNEQEISLQSLLRAPESFPAETLAFINAKFVRFLEKKYGTAKELSKRWGMTVRNFPEVKFHSGKFTGNRAFTGDWQLFCMENAAECLDFFNGVMREIGCDRYISQYNFLPSIGFSRVRAEKTHLVSMNTYFRHPSKMMSRGSVVRQESSLTGSGSEYFKKAATCRIAGMPLFVTEYNHCYWNRYEYEGGIFFPAYSALQSFAGITVHQSPVMEENRPLRLENFRVATSPTKRANEFLAMSLFRRGDVQSSPHRVELLFPAEFLEDGNAGAGAVNTSQAALAFLTGITLRFPELPAKAENGPELSFLPEQSATIHSGAWSSSVEGSVFGNLADSVAKLRTAGILPKNNPTDADAQCFVSDTGELSLDTRARRLKVITPKTEAVILKPDDANLALRQLTVHAVDTGCAAAVTSLDDLPLAESRHMMFVLNTNSVSEGLVLSGDRSTLIEPGKNAPPLMETARIRVSLRCDGKSWKLYPLSLSGERRKPLPVTQQTDGIAFRLDTALLPDGTTPFFELKGE